MNDQLAKVLTANNVSPDLFQAITPDESVFSGVLPYTGILELYFKLMNAGIESGYYPIIRGSEDEDVPPLNHDPAEILSRVPSGSIREILMPRLRERIESIQVFIDELPGRAQDELAPAINTEPPDFDAVAAAVDRAGIHSFGGKIKQEPWPTSFTPQTRISFRTTRERKGKPIRLVLVRLKKSYEVPAYLNFGGWNERPEPELQVAVLREWREAYQARPVCITGDVLECVVPKPPDTEFDAMTLATEQWIFCDDIVSQGTQSVRKLAIENWKRKTWFFWWD